jgi:hypothetical protein
VAASVRWVDEFDAGFGWLLDEERIPRTSHALVADGGVWLVDAVDVDGLDARVRRHGEPRGVIQLLDRHRRDCAAIAARLGVPHVAAYEGRAESPFEFRAIQGRRWWREVALWWRERRVLVCADALGTLRYFRASADRVGVHPVLRLFPPRSLAGLEPERILVGHGEAVAHDAPAALAEALRTSRRRAPGALLAALSGSRRGR